MRNRAGKWKVTFEPCKCKVKPISRKRNPTRTKVRPILWKYQTAGLLGVTFDRKPTWIKPFVTLQPELDRN